MLVVRMKSFRIEGFSRSRFQVQAGIHTLLRKEILDISEFNRIQPKYFVRNVWEST